MEGLRGLGFKVWGEGSGASRLGFGEVFGGLSGFNVLGIIGAGGLGVRFWFFERLRT